MGVNFTVYGRNFNILTSIIAQLLTSRPFGGLSQVGPCPWAIFKATVYRAVILNRGPHGPPGGNLQVLGGGEYRAFGELGRNGPLRGESTNSH